MLCSGSGCGSGAGSYNCWRAGPGSGTALLAASGQPGQRGGTLAALSYPDHCTGAGRGHGTRQLGHPSPACSVDALLPKAKTREGEHTAWVSWLLMLYIEVSW